MSKVDIRLLYQKESGHGIDTITRIAEDPSHDSHEAKEYIKFLETMLESSLSVGNMLLEEWARTTTE